MEHRTELVELWPKLVELSEELTERRKEKFER